MDLTGLDEVEVGLYRRSQRHSNALSIRSCGLRVSSGGEGVLLVRLGIVVMWFLLPWMHFGVKGYTV